MKDGWSGGDNSDWNDDGDTNQDGWGGGYPSKRQEPEYAKKLRYKDYFRSEEHNHMTYEDFMQDDSVC